MPIKLIIFDLDGTIIDSSIDITNAINYAIEPYGIKPITVQETISLVGEGITRLIEKIIVGSQSSENREQTRKIDRDILVERFLAYYSAHLVDKTTIYPRVRETLKTLRDYKKAVISNKREVLSTKILHALGLLEYLDIVVGSDTTPERKPSPVPILYVLSKLNIKTEETVIVGDSNFDIEAGKAAGIKTIAVTYGYRTVDLLNGADFIIDRMDELLDIIRRIR
ncbi:phosphoglycolate phosphatase [Dissulfurispira thermophila]|uniref:phosphoglycolate phosphatase n=2 Tax=root TaxID=1 RepID=A0A7G1H0J9_9BACT|nr:HAD-IA family hydrolase [Dissulfurispira thermophila]BCB95621.1 phosphoglycolate phosphatase [Dissulfurispira thermophila]